MRASKRAVGKWNSLGPVIYSAVLRNSCAKYGNLVFQRDRDCFDELGYVAALSEQGL
jgi:hypothetical protein